MKTTSATERPITAADKLRCAERILKRLNRRDAAPLSDTQIMREILVMEEIAADYRARADIERAANQEPRSP